MGAVTPLAMGAAASWEAALAGACGIRALHVDDLQNPWDAWDLPSAMASIRSRVVGCVDQDALAASPFYGPPSRVAPPFVRYALAAAIEAAHEARLLRGPLGGAAAADDAGSDSGQRVALTDGAAELAERGRIGVLIGAGMSSSAEMGAAGALIAAGRARRLGPYFVPRVLPNMAAGVVSMLLGLRGPIASPSTACATGAHAIGDAFRIVARGEADMMIAGGTDACIDPLSFAGFSAMRALSVARNDDPARASRPFDRARDGFVMAEGAGAVVLESLESARGRGAPVLAEVLGYGTSADAFAVARGRDDGGGAQAAMAAALRDAGRGAEGVAYLNAHATSTVVGDESELRAIAGLFGDHARSGGLLVSSTKGATGHLLGAAGAVEAIFAAKAATSGVAPPTLNLLDPDPAGGVAGLIGARTAFPRGPGVTVSNSFGFGGANVSLVFAPAPAS
ncbi:unnamed protein product [Pedinophyceae sp. YPF-701]|nr:unnamed protein product [Pedinophyceae sp. YPF-701]